MQGEHPLPTGRLGGPCYLQLCRGNTHYPQPCRRAPVTHMPCRGSSHYPQAMVGSTCYPQPCRGSICYPLSMQEKLPLPTVHRGGAPVTRGRAGRAPITYRPCRGSTLYPQLCRGSTRYPQAIDEAAEAGGDTGLASDDRGPHPACPPSRGCGWSFSWGKALCPKDLGLQGCPARPWRPAALPVW